MRKRKSRAKQSPADRMKRMREGCCPIHNLYLHGMPLGPEDEPEQQDCWMLSCSRKDCNFWVYGYRQLGEGPWDVPAQFSHLFAPDLAKPNEVFRVEPSENHKRELAELKARIATIGRLSNLDPQFIPRC
jgi:hypothetical protein